MDIIERARRFLVTRRQAYRRTFSGPVADIVLRDLATVCFAHTSPKCATEREHADADGRRWVWLRIQEHLQLTEEQLWNLYDGRAE